MPTTVPSSQPTAPVPVATCTVGCCLLSNGSSAAVIGNTALEVVTLTSYFKLQFSYSNFTISAYPTISNIIDLRDAITGVSLLYVSIPWSTNTVIGYNGVQIERAGPPLVSNKALYTTITIVVLPGVVQVTSSSNPSWTESIAVASNVITTNRQYYMYVSNANSGSNRLSAGGRIKNICITTGSFYFLFVLF